jgi:glycosyltransferase involved in cell wall biosynthesis
VIEQTIKDENRSNIVIHPRLPREKTCEIVNACDIALSSLFIPGMYGLASPSRTYAILAAGKPQVAITDDGTEVALLIQEGKVGWQVKPRDVDGVVAAIRDAYARRFELHEMQQSARRIAETQYDKRIILHQLAELLTPLFPH